MPVYPRISNDKGKRRLEKHCGMTISRFSEEGKYTHTCQNDPLKILVGTKKANEHYRDENDAYCGGGSVDTPARLGIAYVER